jgi:iron complex outermembrane receptor protein
MACAFARARRSLLDAPTGEVRGVAAIRMVPLARSRPRPSSPHASPHARAHGGSARNAPGGRMQQQSRVAPATPARRLALTIQAALAGCALLPPLVLSQDRIAGLTAPDVVVTATRFEQRAERLPIGMNVIGEAAIRDSGVATLADLLERQAGIFVRDNNGSPNRQIDLRGFGATGDQNTLILLNGQRISENELSAADLSSIPLGSVERIEILRGAGAVLYGGGATGGTINIITRAAQAGSESGRITGTAGSYGTLGLAAEVRKGGEQFGIAVHADHRQSDNFRRENDLRQQNVGGELTWTMPTGRAYLRFAAGQQDLRLPASITETQAAIDPRAAGRLGEWSGLDSSRVTIGTVQTVAGAELAVDVAHRERKSRSFQVGGFNDLVGRVTSVSPRIRLPFEAFGTRQSLVAGSDWDDWNYGNAFASPSFASTATASQNNLAGYLQHTTEFPFGLSITAGGRQQRVVTQVREGGILDQERDLGAYEFAVRQEFAGGLGVFARLGQSFRMPTVDENRFLASLLEPQKSKDREIGVQGRWGPAQWRASVFLSNLSNEITFVPGNLEVSGFGTNANLPPTRRRGVELSSAAPVGEHVVVSGTYSFTDATVREGVFQGIDVSGTRVPLVPRHSATASVAWQVDERLRLRAAARYIGTQPYDNDQANAFGRFMPAYTVVDFLAAYEIGPWRLTGSVLNVLDRDYATWGIVRIDATTRAYDPVARVYPAAGRTLLMTAEYRFGR